LSSSVCPTKTLLDKPAVAPARSPQFSEKFCNSARGQAEIRKQSFQERRRSFTAETAEIAE